MATYNSLIDRTGAEALIPEEVSRDIIQGTPTSSAVLRLGRRLPNMSRKQQRLPVLSLMPYAYFVGGDTGLKQTTEVSWDNKYLNAEEIAVIVPIPEAVLDDADYDIWEQVRPLVIEAFGKKIDGAVLVGTDAPSAWPEDILTGATAASHTVDHSSFTGDYYDEILGEGGLFSLVEEDGFMVTGSVALPTMKARLRGLRATTGEPIFMRSIQDRSRYELDGTPIEFLMNSTVTAATALMFSGDFNQMVYSIRQDVTYKMITEGVITDGSGNIIYNLPQQDMVALRAVMRLAWQIPNPINSTNPDEATRYPFSVLVP